MPNKKEAVNTQPSKNDDWMDKSDPFNEVVERILNKVNVRIPGGAFVLSDDESTLYFRTYVSLPKAVGDEETLNNVGLRIFDLIACVSDWIDVLMGINDGSMNYDDCIKRLEDFYS